MRPKRGGQLIAIELTPRNRNCARNCARRDSVARGQSPRPAPDGLGSPAGQRHPLAGCQPHWEGLAIRFSVTCSASWTKDLKGLSGAGIRFARQERASSRPSAMHETITSR